MLAIMSPVTLFTAAISWFCGLAAIEPAGQPAGATAVRIISDDADKDTVANLKPHLEAGRKTVEQFFGAPFKSTFDIEVFPSRPALDDYLRKRWQIPQSEPWMVAAGVADRMVILSPRVWKTQAAEHNPADA